MTDNTRLLLSAGRKAGNKEIVMENKFLVVSTDALGVKRIVGEKATVAACAAEANLYWTTCATEGEEVMAVGQHSPHAVAATKMASC